MSQPTKSFQPPDRRSVPARSCPVAPFATLVEPVALPDRGRLWSWTIQRFRPKSPPYAGPAEFTPYAVGYVALGDAIIVESRLACVAFDDMRIGLPLRLSTETFTFENGETRLTFAFAPEDRS